MRCIGITVYKRLPGKNESAANAPKQPHFPIISVKLDMFL